MHKPLEQPAPESTSIAEIDPDQNAALRLEVEELRRSMAAMEQERDHFAACMLRYKQLVDLSAEVVAHLSEKHRDQFNAPGHGHSLPGIWDAGNIPGKAGQECKWCATWPSFKSAVEIGGAMTNQGKVGSRAGATIEDCGSVGFSDEKVVPPFSSSFQPGFIEMRRIITQASSISDRVKEVMSYISDDAVTRHSALCALDQIDDYANTIVTMASILQPTRNRI